MSTLVTAGMERTPQVETGAKPNAVVFGNNVAPYHPLRGVEASFHAIFGTDYSLRFTENVAELEKGLPGVRLVIAYADTWEAALAEAPAAGLQDFVARGGGLLVLHNGICWAKHTGIRALMGAVFTGHPEAAVMEYRPCGTHPITAGVPGFSLHEEPYRYDFGGTRPAQVFLQYTHADRAWEAGWAKTHGSGRIVNLQPGHTAASFENSTYAALVRRSALWCANML